MSTDNLTQILTRTVSELSNAESLKGLFHQHRDGAPLPSGKALEEIIELSRSILFPGYYGKSSVNIKTISFHIGVNVERLQKLLTDQIMAGMWFSKCDCEDSDIRDEITECSHKAAEIAVQLIARLPKIRSILATDVVAAYNGDPAAESYAEIISCYPVIKALTNYRLAHELVELGVPLIPRIISEMERVSTYTPQHRLAVTSP